MIKTPSASVATLGNTQVRWVFGKAPDMLRQQIVAFWLHEGALTSPDEAWRRSWEVASVLQEMESGHILGACTVAILLDDHGASYGFVRLYIRPASRLAGFNVRLMETMIEGFKAMMHEPGAPRRLIVILENRKIERRAAQRIMGRLGFVHAGTAPGGKVVMQCSLTA
ncbi:hypothetical protein [Rhodanobacter sp. C03]|uniref:hypothetical protein n=1 Tax=Rhodanobacter sp. C03 TaxID=1945858 RepID=UPI000986B591|nr:hypothetical protein [Rhodanobacter sp. C03]OOG57255.1 hypothetical protein B0E48_07275 [Rhodanobacter sp. C03]